MGVQSRRPPSRSWAVTSGCGRGWRARGTSEWWTIQAGGVGGWSRPRPAPARDGIPATRRALDELAAVFGGQLAGESSSTSCACSTKRDAGGVPGAGAGAWRRRAASLWNCDERLLRDGASTTKPLPPGVPGPRESGRRCGCDDVGTSAVDGNARGFRPGSGRCGMFKNGMDFRLKLRRVPWRTSSLREQVQIRNEHVGHMVSSSMQSW